MSADRARFAALAALSLLATLALGMALRWFLAGVPLPAGTFAHLRSAHSHLGYYGVLFPLLWWAWAGLGVPVPGRGVTAVYAVSVGAATIGFAREGYAFLSIVTSTIVLGIWLLSAWQVRGRALRGRDWLAPAAPAIILSAIAIPGVAVFMGRAPDFAQDLVHFFLSLLLFGLLVPTALLTIRAPEPPPWLWGVSALGAALALGPLPHPVTHLSLALLGGLIAVAGWRAPVDLALRLLWVGLALALLGMGTRLLPDLPPVAVAGVHFAVLGPVLLSLARDLLPPVPPAVRLAYGALLALFTLAVMLQAWGVFGNLAGLAAWTGTAVALVVTAAVLAGGRES